MAETTVGSYITRILFQRKRTELEKEIERHQATLAKEPDNETALFQLGYCHMPDVVEKAGAELGLSREAMLEKAAEYFARLIALRERRNSAVPEDKIAYFNLGLARFYLRQYAAAEDGFHRAANIDAEYGRAIFMLGRSRQLLGKTDAAITAFNRVIELDPAAADGYAELGNIFAAKQEFARAVGYYEKAVQLEINNAAYIFLLGAVKGNAGDHAAARTCFEKAVALAPDRAAYHYELWRACCNCKPSKEEVMADVAKHGGYSAGSGEWVSTVEHKRVADVLYHLENAARLDPYYADILAGIYLGREKFQAAADNYARYYAAAAKDRWIGKNAADKARKYAAYCLKRIELFGTAEVES